jgi:hypothetical protein
LIGQGNPGNRSTPGAHMVTTLRCLLQLRTMAAGQKPNGVCPLLMLYSRPFHGLLLQSH